MSEGTILARFNAMVRRPRPQGSGLLAELFAPNGDDADAVIGLGRSALVDAQVDVDISFAGGTAGGFVADLRRPLPRAAGMIACFWGEHGEAADAITALSLSKYLDGQVAVVVRLLKLPDGAKPPKVKGQFADASTVLWKSTFVGDSRVRDAIGRRDDYPAWVAQRPCCCGKEQGEHSGDVSAIEVLLDDLDGYLHFPFCALHAKEIPYFGIDWLVRQRVISIRHWVWENLRRVAAAESMADVDPSIIRTWAEQAGVSKLLPEGYR